MAGETQGEQSRGGLIRSILHRISPFIVLAIFALALFLLYRVVRGYDLEEVWDAILKIPRRKIVLSCLLMVINYVILIGYDVLAVKSINHSLPLRRIALASFTGFATSYSFGALLGGGSVRFRLYTAWGLSPAEIVQLVVILGFTFWFGVFALAGVVFVVHPFDISPDWNLPFQSAFPLGFPLIGLAAGYLAVAAAWKKPIRIQGKDVKLPGFRMSVAQLSVAAADLIAAAACFYVLLPDDIDLSYMTFLGVYLLAVVVVVLSHVPGGFGVFELVVLTASPVANKELLAAAILLFRVIYYLLPLLVAAVLLGLYELRLRSATFRRMIGKSED